MLMIGLIIVLPCLGLWLLCKGEYEDSGILLFIGILMCLIALGLFIFGCFNGFVYYPATEGTHQGTVTAVDLEGIYFRRYEVYLKSSGYTGQSDETVYKIYADETELAEQLKNAIGKTVKLHYGHDGGFIGWNSCGTYHIKSIEIIEE